MSLTMGRAPRRKSNQPPEVPKTYLVTAMIPTQLEVTATSLEEAGKIAKSMSNEGEKVEYPLYGEARSEAKPFPLTIEEISESDGVDK